MQILAATDFSTRSNRALRQAGLLAQGGNTKIHLLHVVDDDQPEDRLGASVRRAQRPPACPSLAIQALKTAVR